MATFSIPSRQTLRYQAKSSNRKVATIAPHLADLDEKNDCTVLPILVSTFCQALKSIWKQELTDCIYCTLLFSPRAQGYILDYLLKDKGVSKEGVENSWATVATQPQFLPFLARLRVLFLKHKSRRNYSKSYKYD
jgi:hypothetical protein